LWPLGVLAIGISLAGTSTIEVWPALEVLNTPWLNWLGVISRKPVTEDYVPLLPWLGVMWWVMATGRWVLREQAQWLGSGAPARGGRKALVQLGRWSLCYYLLHQPVLMGLSWLGSPRA
jgi:uncharacterized membrane protein